jgi:putative CocE/NonD family hydrolase
MLAMPCLRPIALVCGIIACVASHVAAQDKPTRAEKIRASYAKFEYQIPVRDGAKLFTACYIPYDAGPDKLYPILMVRTPYSVGPYGADQYRSSLGPSEAFEDAGYIFVFQDVRGRYLSEGEFVNMRPHRDVKSEGQIDESSDTYDTIEWLTQNIDFHNGRVGQWGISYPGFYTSAGAIDSHPALKCISPQAPIADWFWDDMHRNGAFNVQLATTFFSSFGHSRPKPSLERHERIDFKTEDAYQFFLELGPLKNVNKNYFHDQIAFWNETVQHPNYDQFWQSRNLLPHLKNINCACLVVGGWFDTEDLYGPLKTYQAIEQFNPQVENSLVMGPWYHGGWNGSDGDALGDADFDWATAKWYREQVEFPFFERHLKLAEASPVAEATVFETGANRWRRFEHWPPQQSLPKSLYLAADHSENPQVASCCHSRAAPGIHRPASTPSPHRNRWC